MKFFVQAPDVVQNHLSSFALSNTELSSSLGCVHVSKDSRENIQQLILVVVMIMTQLKKTYTYTKMLLDDQFFKAFSTTTCDFSITSTISFQNPEVALDRSPSFAFSNFESSNFFLNATPFVCFDSGDAFFRFVIPELFIMYVTLRQGTQNKLT